MCYRAVASYDGTDIMMPTVIDNSTGVPQFKQIEIDDYDPLSRKSKRAATPFRSHLWPNGLVYFRFHDNVSGKAYSV